MIHARSLALVTALLMPLPHARAQATPHPLLERLAGELDDAGDAPTTTAPAGTRLLRDLAYGPDPAQRLDVYLPIEPPAAPAPVVFFVHGGGWRTGDKGNRRVVEPKVAHWVAQGYAVVSANTRLLPVPVAQQEEDVAAALAFAQSRAGTWHADPARVIVMGHSAGAHLVALLAAGAKTAAHPQPWRGAVLLDSAALDVAAIMDERHLPLYDQAFGADPQQWHALSPIAQLARTTAPMLAVCSSRRRDSCPQAERFAAKANALGGQVRVLREDLSHGEINATLGAASDYTAQVDAFMRQVLR